jgi:hypothetical protein
MSTENLNFKVFNISSALRGLSDRDRKLRETNPTSVLYVEDVYRLIDMKTVDSEVKNVLKEEAKKLPHKALPGFAARLDHLVGIRMKQINEKKYAAQNPQAEKETQEAPITADDLVSLQDSLYNSMENNGDGDAKESLGNDVQEKTQE